MPKGRRIPSPLRARLIATTAFSAAALAISAQPALAQAGAAGQGAAPARLEEVVVTARRVNERIQDVPVAVTALSSETLLRQSIQRAEDLPHVSAGLTVSPSPRGQSAPNYMIRGQRGAFNPSSLTDPAVAVYFADLNQTRSVGTNQTLFDLDSVQILRGPQGTLFGRNSTGGAILITPKSPSQEFEGYGQFTGGNFDYRDAEGVLNIPLGEKIAIRGAVKISKRDGYLTNVLDGRKPDDLDAKAYRLSVSLRPTDDLTSVVIGSWYEGGGVGFATKLNVVDTNGIPAALGTLRPVVAARLNAELAATRALGDYEVRGSPNLSIRETASSIQNNTEWRLGERGILGDVSVKNIVGFRRVTSHPYQEFTGSSLAYFAVAADVAQKAFSDEFQVSGSNGKLSYVGGLYYNSENTREHGIGAQFGMLSSLPGPFAALFPSYVVYDLDIRSRSKAAFIHADYKLDDLLDGLSISGGVRVTHDRRHVVWHNMTYAGVVPAGFVCSLTGAALPRPDRTLCAVDGGTLSSTEPTYDVSLNYKINDRLLIYAAHRRGYRSGSFNQSPLALVGVNRTFEPEFVRDVEFGEKADFNLGGMAGRLNTALYYQDYSDIQRTVFIQHPITAQASSQIVNAARAHVYGGEVELTLQPADGLTLSANYAYTKAKYDRWNDIYVVAGVAHPVDISDSKFAFVPTHQWSLSASYRLPLEDRAGDVLLNVNWYGQSKQATTDTFTHNCAGGLYPACLNSAYVLPAYNLLNLRADWKNVAGKGFDLSAFVNNVTDKYYFNYATNLLGLLGTNSVGIGAPRMYGVSLRVPFGASAY